MRRRKDTLQNDPLDWNDGRHLTPHRPAAATSRVARVSWHRVEERASLGSAAADPKITEKGDEKTHRDTLEWMRRRYASQSPVATWSQYVTPSSNQRMNRRPPS